MEIGEWSRSRFWLCHFLHNRHVRPSIAWDSAGEVPPPLAKPLGKWLSQCARDSECFDRWVMRCAPGRYPEDPAYIQSLRLFVREHQYHGKLCAQLLNRYARRRPKHLPPLAQLVSQPILGIRFRLSVLLLGDLIRTTMLEMLAGATTDTALADACRAIAQDKKQHIAFASERLTMEYADFNFIRRNLRRARLRVMFAVMLAETVRRDGRLIAASGNRRRQFVRTCWASFASMLQWVVPYRRDELLKVLLTQRERPYAKPQEGNG